MWSGSLSVLSVMVGALAEDFNVLTGNAYSAMIMKTPWSIYVSAARLLPVVSITSSRLCGMVVLMPYFSAIGTSKKTVHWPSYMPFIGMEFSRSTTGFDTPMLRVTRLCTGQF